MKIILALFILNLMKQTDSRESGNLNYNPAELLSKIFKLNETITPRQINNGFIKFEDNYEPPIDAGNGPSQAITFDERPNTFKFEDDFETNNADNIFDIEPSLNPGFSFQDDNKIEPPKLPKKKRKRKPKYQNNGYAAAPNQIFPDQNPVYPQKYLGNDKYQPITFDGQSGPNSFKFEDGPNVNHGDNDPYLQKPNSQNNPQDGNQQDKPQPPKKKRRRRRRKPRYQTFGGIPNQNQGYPYQYPNVPQNLQGSAPQGYPIYPGQAQGYPGQYPGNQGFGGQYPYPYPASPPGQYYRPPRRPKQSIASEALSAVTGALTSIALYDDYQCVPRLLCEAAGGGALGSSSVLQNVAGLQPLLTLLAAYNGISSSPLFLFGRAVFLGMTAKGNLGTCRYAYPQCPTDPEQLVHYLNNHNGGFFRFFSAPQLNNQFGHQNVEQFYNQLSQNYGLYQDPAQLGNQQNYAIYQPSQLSNGINNINNLNNNINQQSPLNQINYPNYQANQQGYGFESTNLYDNRPQTYGLQNYGPNYAYQGNYGFNRFKSNDKEVKQNKIEKRIINGEINYAISTLKDNDSPKWLSTKFTNNVNSFNNNRGGRELRFPDEVTNQYYTFGDTSDDIRKGKGFSFPDQNNINNVNYYTALTTTPSYNKYGLYQTKYRIQNHVPSNHYQNHYVNQQNNNDQNSNAEGIQTVYIVRGNGDPNHPEIVKLKPGEKLQ